MSGSGSWFSCREYQEMFPYSEKRKELLKQAAAKSHSKTDFFLFLTERDLETLVSLPERSGAVYSSLYQTGQRNKAALEAKIRANHNQTPNPASNQNPDTQNLVEQLLNFIGGEIDRKTKDIPTTLERVRQDANAFLQKLKEQATFVEYQTENYLAQKCADKISELQKLLDAIPKETHLHFPKCEKIILPSTEQYHSSVVNILPYIKLGKNVLLYGPSGTGKTHIAWQISKLLGKTFYSLSCNPEMSSVDIFGYNFPGPNGERIFHSTPFIECAINGGVCVFDEFDRIPPGLASLLNSALSNKFFTCARDSQTINLHSEAVFVFCQNTIGLGNTAQFNASIRQSADVRDRTVLTKFLISYDRKLETKLVSEIFNDEAEASRFLEFAWKLRDKLITEKVLDIQVTTRFLIDGATFLKAGIDNYDSLCSRLILTSAQDNPDYQKRVKSFCEYALGRAITFNQFFN